MVNGDAAAKPEGLAAAAESVQRLAGEVHALGWICFGARSEAGDWDLYLCRPDGSRQRNLTGTPDQNEFAPQFSRDGQRLLYRRIPRSETVNGNHYGEQGQLMMARCDGRNPELLGEPGEFPWATWGPDGRQVACLSVLGIALVDVARREVVRTLNRRGFFQQIVWSPNGRWLVGVANSYGTGWSVARLELANGEARALNRVDCCTPDWFPDAQSVIFSWRPPGQKGNGGQGWTQLWAVDAEGANRHRRLVYGEDGRHVYGGHVSPDGRYVLFTGNVEEDGDPGRAGAPMGLMRLRDAPIIGGDSPELRALHAGARNGPVLRLPAGWEPCWTSNELWSATILDPSPASRSSPSQTSTAMLATELRGRGWLAFSAKTATGDWDLFAMRPDGSARRPLTNTREYNEAGVRFSPDGTRLLYYRLPRDEAVDNNTYGTFELVLAQADGSGVEVFGTRYPWASWGPGGRELACLTSQGIQVIDVKTRAVVRRFPRKGMISQLGWSPDGQRMVGTANGLGQFWNIGVLDVPTGEIHAVSETERYNCTPDWCADSEQVVYARGIVPNVAGHAEIWVASADGRTRRRLYAEAGHHLYGACASPDGQYVLYTRSVEDLGRVPDIEMAVIRWPAASDAEAPGGVVRLDLGPGWEPHWTAKEIQP